MIGSWSRHFQFARFARFATALVLVALVWLLHAPTARADAYEAKLPEGINTAPDLCALVPCRDVLPAATSFSPRKGQPTYVEGHAGEGGARKLVGYVLLSTDITDIPAYSGKPVITLIGMDAAGRLTGVKVLKHSEPILLLGIPEAALTKFNDQYVGKDVHDNLEIGRSRPQENIVGIGTDRHIADLLTFLKLHGDLAGAVDLNEVRQIIPAHSA